MKEELLSQYIKQYSNINKSNIEKEKLLKLIQDEYKEKYCHIFTTLSSLNLLTFTLCSSFLFLSVKNIQEIWSSSSLNNKLSNIFYVALLLSGTALSVKSFKEHEWSNNLKIYNINNFLTKLLPEFLDNNLALLNHNQEFEYKENLFNLEVKNKIQEQISADSLMPFYTSILTEKVDEDDIKAYEDFANDYKRILRINRIIKDFRINRHNALIELIHCAVIKSNRLSHIKLHFPFQHLIPYIMSFINDDLYNLYGLRGNLKL